MKMYAIYKVEDDLSKILLVVHSRYSYALRDMQRLKKQGHLGSRFEILAFTQ